MIWFLQLLLFISLLLISVRLLGSYMATVFQGKAHFLKYVLGWLEKLIYKLCNINEQEEMNWKTYAKALLIFNLIGFAFLFFLQLIQGWLPLNPQNFSGIEWSLAFNTAISFTTNTNWQAYAGENSMSYLTQMSGLTVQNFLSAATGNCALLAFIRGMSRPLTQSLGNFWVDLTRAIVYLLLPLSIFFSLILVSQGVIQNLNSYVEATTLSGESQLIPMGPAASQIAIKQLGTNGGGFFNANSAHPFENPTPLTNFLESFAIFLIPASTTYMYGVMIGSKKSGWIILFVMLVLWLLGLGISLAAEHTADSVLGTKPILEGVETRIGINNSAFWAVSTTGTSNGSVNAMMSSLSPLTGGVSMFNMMIEEVIIGGIGVGLAGMIMFALLTVFLAGLMVGRTPEYLGKKIEKSEMQWVMLALLIPGVLILFGTGIALLSQTALENVSNAGPHGLSEILYAFSSAAGNNGSAFAGLNANTLFFNLSLAIVMLLSRLAILIPSLAIAGSLAQKKVIAPSLGTFETNTFLFGIVLLSVIFVFAALTFFPALSLGPIVEHVLMIRGRSF